MKASWKPNRKVSYGATWGVLTSFLTWLIPQFGFIDAPPAELASAITLVVMSVASYVTRNPEHPK